MISVTEVSIAPDFRQATIFVSIFGSAELQKQALEVLDENAKNLRFDLSQAMHIKRIPALKFRLDGSLEQGDKMARLLNDNLSDNSDE